jgi:hypothetical protein
MFVADDEKSSYLNEWECVLDDSVLNGYDFGDDIPEEGFFWYLIKGSNDIALDVDSNNHYILVKIRIANSGIYIVNNEGTADRILSESDFYNGILDIYEDWVNLNTTNQYILNNINKPDYNKVYRVIDHNGISYNMIYYLNQGWYPIDFIDSQKQDLMLAKVPISGMIEYKANIYKEGWEIRND